MGQQQRELDFDRGRLLRLIDEVELPHVKGSSQVKNLLRVLTWCGRDTGDSCPRLELLAYRMGCSINTARRAVQAAVEIGLIAVQARITHAGGQRSNSYAIDEGVLASFPQTGPTFVDGRGTKDGRAPSQDGRAPSQDGRAPSQVGRANIYPGSLVTGNQTPSRRDTGAAGVSSKRSDRPDAGSEPAGAASVFAAITAETLRDTQALLAWVAWAAGRPRPVVSASDADRLRVVAAAERAIEVVERDGGRAERLFGAIVVRKDWRLISQAQEERAAARLRASGEQEATRPARLAGPTDAVARDRALRAEAAAEPASAGLAEELRRMARGEP